MARHRFQICGFHVRVDLSQGDVAEIMPDCCCDMVGHRADTREGVVPVSRGWLAGQPDDHVTGAAKDKAALPLVKMGGDDMTKVDQTLMLAAEGLEQRILGSHRADRLSLRADFSKALSRLRASRARVPMRMVRLDQMLSEEAAEDMFDNMPV